MEDYVQHAYDIGLNGVAITEHETVGSHIRALEKAQEIQKEDPTFKLILGNEIYLVDRAKESSEDRIQYYHFILLAKNLIGHRTIRKLSSLAWENSYFDRRLRRVPTLKIWMEEHKEQIKGNIIGSTACLGSEFAQNILRLLETDNVVYKQEIHNFIQWCIDIFGKEDFYIELQPSLDTSQVEYNQKAIQIAKAYGLKFIMTNDVHYLEQKDKEVHSIYLKSKEEERETADFYSNTYFKNVEEMRQRTPLISQEDFDLAISNTMLIYDSVEEYDLRQDVIVPERSLPSFKLKHIFKDYYNKYEYINNFAKSGALQDQFMLYQIEKGFIKFEQEYNEENLSRIDVELEQLWKISINLKQRLSSYYNLTQRIVEIMWDDLLGNSFVGISRGSVGGFYTSYLMEIIQINPIEHDLPWWRHISSYRPELPDIDLDSQGNRRAFIFDSIKREFGYHKGLNVCTFKTEKTKSALLSSCRGLGIDIDKAQEMSDLIPSERGFLWTMSDCINGNEEKDRKPVTQLTNLMKQYENLIETTLKIEGLINGYSSHASAFYIFNDEYIEQNALMKTPSGDYVTQFNMTDSDKMGGLKVDCLTIKALDKQRKAFDWLLKEDVIKWQGNLRETYNKYFHPDNIDLEDEKMWENINKGRVIDLFQFETLVGSQAIKLLQPKSVIEMSKGNSAMRLMAEDGEESPLAIFKQYKENVQDWYNMANEYGLTEEEISILENHLKDFYMIALEQEDIMQLVMDKNISNFDLTLANKLRKGVGKKKIKIIEEVKEIYYQKGLEIGSRKEFLDFVWDKEIMLQAGYGFSKNHSVPYSLIALQEAMIATRYGRVYWNTACLTINSESAEDEVFNEDKTNKSTQYGKIAKAISAMQNRGIEVALPDINKANFEFTPDASNNRIIFGLKGISHIGDELCNQIIEKRPYKKIEDVISLVSPTNVQLFYLTKSGAFDSLYPNLDRKEIMEIVLVNIAEKELKDSYKTKLNMQNFNSIVKLDLLEEADKIFIRYWRFKKYILKNEYKIGKIRNKVVYKLNEISQPFFEENFAKALDIDKDFWYNKEEEIEFYKSSFEKVYKKAEDRIKEKINLEEFINKYNIALKDNLINELREKYCLGSTSKWEMDSISYYHGEHELQNINKDSFNIVDFSSLDEEPTFEPMVSKNGRKWLKFDLSRIAGTVLDIDKTKHIVYLLTTDGVVNVKFYDGAFVYYNKTISRINEDGSKTRMEESWFKRGTKLLISGYRKGNQFKPKRYYNSILQHTVAKVQSIDSQGDLKISTDRIKV